MDNATPILWQERDRAKVIKDDGTTLEERGICGPKRGCLRIFCLRLEGRVSMLAVMKFAAFFASSFLGSTLFFMPVAVHGQALQVDMEEFKRLAGEVADLKEANAAQLRRVRELQNQVDSLRAALRESNERSTTKLADFATREDLKKIVDSIREVDEKREKDNKLVLEQISQLGKTLATPPAETSKPPRRSNRESSRETKDSNDDTPAAPIEGEFYEYTVQKNDIFSKIVSDWNSTLKEKGRKTVSYDDVKRANPKLNPNRIFEGQKILLPLPSDKK